MSKSKLSKRQIAGALLLSSTAIGATASGTVSAGFMDFMKNTIESVSAHTWAVAKEFFYSGEAKACFYAFVFCSLGILACCIILKKGADAILQEEFIRNNIMIFSENIEGFIKIINEKLEKNAKLINGLKKLKSNLSDKSENKDFIEKLNSCIITSNESESKYLLIDDFINEIAQKNQEEIENSSKEIIGSDASIKKKLAEDFPNASKMKKLPDNISNFSKEINVFIEQIDSFIEQIENESKENEEFKNLLSKINSELEQELKNSPNEKTFKDKVFIFKDSYTKLNYKDEKMEECYEKTISKLPNPMKELPTIMINNTNYSNN